MDIKDLKFQQLDKVGLRQLIDLAEKEGWDPGKYDYEVFWNTDPEGFVGYYLDDRLIAGGSIVSYNGKYGFMGLFIVQPDYRRKGIGKKLWYLRRDLLLSRLEEGATIGMDGVVEMQPFYKKGGFEIAFKDVRFECTGREISVSDKVSHIEQSDLGQLLQYDKSCFGYNRLEFLKRWIAIPGSKPFKYVSDNQCKGYAVLRQIPSGYKVAPLFADDEIVAEALYHSCLNAVPEQLVYIDVPMINSKAVDLVKRYNAKQVYECARMYHGETPKLDIDRVYGITTFELG